VTTSHNILQAGFDLFISVKHCIVFPYCLQKNIIHVKNGFVTATKLGTTNEFFVATTKNFAATNKRFVDRTKHFVATKYFCYPYFNK